MNSRLLLALLAFGASASGFAQATATSAPEETEKKSSMKEILKARMREEAKKAPPTPASGSTPATANTSGAGTSTTGSAATTPSPTTAAGTAATTANKESDSNKKAAAETAKQPATVLPKVEVQRSRITELDRQLAKQEQDIAREKKNMKQGEIDVALNDAKTAKTLSIFGGESSEHRAGIAAERVSLMEAEKDIIEAIAQTKDKAKKAELQKQLDELRTFRRELEKNRR